MKLDYLKIYNVVGTIACGIAGGIVGFVTGGLFTAVAGVIIGAAAGFLFEKILLKAKKA